MEPFLNRAFQAQPFLLRAGLSDIDNKRSLTEAEDAGLIIVILFMIFP
jgi:hypothetical protein